MHLLQVHLCDTVIAGCQGPGLDVSDNAAAWLNRAEAISSHINGGSSYAVLLDADAFARGSSTSIDGPCHVSSPDSPRTSDQPTARHSASTRLTSTTSSTLSDGGTLQSPAGATMTTAATGSGLQRNPGCAAADKCQDRTGHREVNIQMSDTASDEPDADCFFSPDSQAAAHASPFSAVRALLGVGTAGQNNNKQNVTAIIGKDCSNDTQDTPMLVTAVMTVRQAAVAAALFPSEEGAFAYEDMHF
eukprot:gene13932-biopygen15545